MYEENSDNHTLHKKEHAASELIPVAHSEPQRGKVVSIQLDVHFPQISKKVFLVAGLIIVLASSLWWGYNRMIKSSVPPLTPSVVNNLNLDIYYPRTLPSEMSIPARSAQVNSGQSLQFTIKDGAQSLLVSESAKPGLNFPQIYAERLKDAKTVRLATGALTVGNFKVNDDRATGSLLTKKTWVAIFAPPNYNLDKIIQIAKSLEIQKSN